MTRRTPGRTIASRARAVAWARARAATSRIPVRPGAGWRGSRRLSWRSPHCDRGREPWAGSACAAGRACLVRVRAGCATHEGPSTTGVEPGPTRAARQPSWLRWRVRRAAAMRGERHGVAVRRGAVVVATEAQAEGRACRRAR
eukprot:2843025-Prymnesium_polylepis.1